MRPLIFRYQLYKGISSPIIPLGLKSAIGWRKVWAYVDSGSIYSIMQAGEAERLRINIEAGTERKVKAGDGDVFSIYLHPLEVQLGKRRFKTQIGFSRDLKVGFNILGRRPFFEKFRVCFNDRKRAVSFY